MCLGKVGKTIGDIGGYLGHQFSDPISLSLDPFNGSNWRREAGDAFNSDPGHVVRDVFGQGTADSLHSTFGAVVPAVAGLVGTAVGSVFGNPELGPIAAGATRAGINYSNGASLGSSLKSGAIGGLTSYAGQELGSLGSGALGSGSGAAGSSYGGAAAGSYGDVTNTGIDSIGSGFGNSAGNTIGNVASTAGSTVGSNAGTFASDLGSNALTSTAGNTVANSGGSLLGNLAGYGKIASPILSAGIGTYSNLQAKNDLLDATKKNQALISPFLNQSFNPGDLTKDPGYQFELQQGQQGLDRQQAARGNYFSGQALTDAAKFNQGLAGTTYNDAFNRFLANQGQKLSAASALTGVNNDAANAKAGSITNIGNLLAGSAGSLLNGSAYSNTGNVLGQNNNDLLAKYLAQQGRTSYGA